MAELKENMPSDYLTSKIVNDVTYPLDLENDFLVDKIISMIKEFNVSTATTTLHRYEEQYALPQNPSITIEERRSRVKAKMRSNGVINKKTLQKIVNAWSNADVEVIEDFNNYTVTIEFVSVVGIPSRIEDVYAAVKEVIPAHLNVIYKFRFNTVKDLRETAWTVKQLADSGKTVKQLTDEELVL